MPLDDQHTTHLVQSPPMLASLSLHSESLGVLPQSQPLGATPSRPAVMHQAPSNTRNRPSARRMAPSTAIRRIPARNSQVRLPVNPRRHTVAPDQRKRVKVACNRCNVLRVRCSGEQPCRKCSGSLHVCEYPSPSPDKSELGLEVERLRQRCAAYERILRTSLPDFAADLIHQVERDEHNAAEATESDFIHDQDSLDSTSDRTLAPTPASLGSQPYSPHDSSSYAPTLVPAISSMHRQPLPTFSELYNHQELWEHPQLPPLNLDAPEPAIQGLGVMEPEIHHESFTSSGVTHRRV